MLHIVMLHAPDFPGCESAVDLAREHGQLPRREPRHGRLRQ
jgi:hypothetical protein